MDFASHFKDEPAFADLLKNRGASQQNLSSYLSVKVYALDDDLDSFDPSKLFVSGYIWEREPPIARKCQDCWEISMRFGDSIGDEKLLISLFLDISVSESNLAFNFDGYEGDPLVIESSDHLPRWFTRSDNQSNRLFLLAGNLVLVPRDFSAETWSSARAIESLQSGRYDLMSEAEQLIRSNLTELPLSRQNYRVARATLPHKLASLLSSAPQLISILSEYYPGDSPRFYSRELIDFVSPPNSPTVVVSVKFTSLQLLNFRLVDLSSESRLFSDLQRDGDGLWDDKSMDLGRKLCVAFYFALHANSDDSERLRSIFGNVGESTARLRDYVENVLTTACLNYNQEKEDDETWIASMLQEAATVNPNDVEDELSVLTRLLGEKLGTQSGSDSD